MIVQLRKINADLLTLDYSICSNESSVRLHTARMKIEEVVLLIQKRIA